MKEKYFNLSQIADGWGLLHSVQVKKVDSHKRKENYILNSFQ